MKPILIGAILLITQAAIADEFLSISLNKKVYSVGEKFEVTLINNADKPILYLRIGIEALENGEWLDVRTDISCPCLAKCKKAASVIPTGRSKIEMWDYRVLRNIGVASCSATFNAPSGTMLKSRRAIADTVTPKIGVGLSCP